MNADTIDLLPVRLPVTKLPSEAQQEGAATGHFIFSRGKVFRLFSIFILFYAVVYSPIGGQITFGFLNGLSSWTVIKKDCLRCIRKHREIMCFFRQRCLKSDLLSGARRSKGGF